MFSSFSFNFKATTDTKTFSVSNFRNCLSTRYYEKGNWHLIDNLFKHAKLILNSRGNYLDKGNNLKMVVILKSTIDFILLFGFNLSPPPHPNNETRVQMNRRKFEKVVRNELEV